MFGLITTTVGFSAREKRSDSPSPRACPSPAPRAMLRPSSSQGGRHSHIIVLVAAAGAAPPKWFQGSPATVPRVVGLRAEPVHRQHGGGQTPPQSRPALVGHQGVVQRPRPAVGRPASGRLAPLPPGGLGPKPLRLRPGKVTPVAIEAIPTRKQSRWPTARLRLVGAGTAPARLEVGAAPRRSSTPRGFRAST